MKASPYTPGAGHVPPILAGRQGLTGAWEEMLSEIESSGRMHAEDTILSGPRGAGKTALLSTFHNLAEDAGYEVIVLQSVKGRGSLIDGLMRRANQRILANSGAWTKAKNTLERIGSVSLGVAGFSASAAVKTATPRPLPDAGLFADGLAELARAVRDEARHGGLLITIDELQVTDPADLALLAAALHRLNVEHPESHVAFAATGLPNTMGVLEAAGVTHPHRLFEERPVTLRLDERATRYAIAKPALDRDVTWEDAALTIAVRASNCYLAHIQEVAHATWREAGGPDVISEADARAGVHSAGERIARRELTPRWAAATDREVELLAALALNGGHGTSTEINAMLGREQKEWSAVRASLISAGDIYPTGQRAQLAFAMPTYPAYVLANYPFRQAAAGAVALVSLDEMRRRREQV